jgi:hypothetical protein
LVFTDNEIKLQRSHIAPNMSDFPDIECTFKYLNMRAVLGGWLSTGSNEASSPQVKRNL